MDVNGLWVGTATITNVSEIKTNLFNTPTPAASRFQFRLMVHQGDDGRARHGRQNFSVNSEAKTASSPESANTIAR